MCPTPVTSDVHVDVALTNISQKYNNMELIGGKIAPAVPVKKDSDKYFVYGKQHLRIDDSTRAPGTRAKQVDWTIQATNLYSLVDHAYEAQLIDEVRDNADDPIKYDTDTIEFVTDKLQIDFEKTIADAVQLSSNYTNFADPVSGKWDDPQSDPVEDVDSAKNTIRKAILQTPNSIVVPWKVHLILRRHPKLLDMYKYTRGGVLSTDIMAEIFEVDNYYIGQAGYLSSAEGQVDVISDLWGNKVSLLYIPKTPGLKQLSWGYTFRKSGYPLVSKWREEAVASDWIRVGDKYDFKITSKDAGYLFTNVLASF